MKKMKMKVTTLCLSLGMVAGTLLTPVSAYAATSTASANSKSIIEESKAWAPGVNFNVNIDALGIANKIAESISRGNYNGQRAAFCKNLMETSFYAAGGRYNVVVMDLSQNYNYRLSGIKMYAGYQFDGTTFGVWVFDRNQPKGSYFRNDGRRGYDHWACRGWQTQDGNTMWYNR